MGVPGMQLRPGAVECPALTAEHESLRLKLRLRTVGRGKDPAVQGDALHGAAREVGPPAAVPADPPSLRSRLAAPEGSTVPQQHPDEGEETSDGSEAVRLSILLPVTQGSSCS